MDTANDSVAATSASSSKILCDGRVKMHFLQSRLVENISQQLEFAHLNKNVFLENGGVLVDSIAPEQHKLD